MYRASCCRPCFVLMIGGRFCLNLPFIAPSGSCTCRIMHVALSEHMGYFGNSLDCRSRLPLQDYLQSDPPFGTSK